MLNNADSSLFFSRNDPDDPRLGDWSRAGNPDSNEKSDLILWGYPDDEGIRMNGGRIGAAQAPKQIRTSFFKMTPALGKASPKKISDWGDLKVEGDLPARHQQAQSLAQKATASGARWISMGGGHDYGYSDASGFLSGLSDSKLKPVLMNFDAHLDVRPTTKGFNSGTPFRRLLEEQKNPFSFFEFGLQPQCNSQVHWDWAKSKGAELFTNEEVAGSRLLEQVQKSFSVLKNHPTWISLDIDVLTKTEAPGCSQAWVTGLETKNVMSALKWIYQNLDVRGLSIYEVSPPLDIDGRTSQTAALFMHQFLFAK